MAAAVAAACCDLAGTEIDSAVGVAVALASGRDILLVTDGKSYRLNPQHYTACGDLPGQTKEGMPTMGKTTHKISWSPALQTGITSIDEARKRLIEIVNLINDPEVLKNARDLSPELIDGMKEVFKNYFDAEEELMFKIDYVAVDKHLLSHSVLLSSFDMAIVHFRETGIMDRISDFVSDIFVNHLMSDDTSLSLQIQKRRAALAERDAKKNTVEGIKKKIISRK